MISIDYQVSILVSIFVVTAKFFGIRWNPFKWLIINWLPQCAQLQCKPVALQMNFFKFTAQKVKNRFPVADAVKQSLFQPETFKLFQLTLVRSSYHQVMEIWTSV